MGVQHNMAVNLHPFVLERFRFPTYCTENTGMKNKTMTQFNFVQFCLHSRWVEFHESTCTAIADCLYAQVRKAG